MGGSRTGARRLAGRMPRPGGRAHISPWSMATPREHTVRARRPRPHRHRLRPHRRCRRVRGCRTGGAGRRGRSPAPSCAAGAASPTATLLDLLELGRSLAALVAAARPLDGSKLQPPHADPRPGIDVGELADRAARAEASRGRRSRRSTRHWPADGAEAVHAAVAAGWGFGLGDAAVPATTGRGVAARRGRPCPRPLAGPSRRGRRDPRPPRGGTSSPPSRPASGAARARLRGAAAFPRTRRPPTSSRRATTRRWPATIRWWRRPG